MNQPGNPTKCLEVTWIENVIKFTCDLDGFDNEPTDHTFVHWAFIEAYATLIQSQLEYLGNNSLELVTVARTNGSEMLSSTDYATLDKVFNKTITTKVEWSQDAEIVIYEPPILAETQATEQIIDLLKAPRGDGFYLVGSEIAPGIWDSDGTENTCYWAVTTSKGDIIANHFGLAGGTAYVPIDAFEVQFKKCGNWTWLQE